jgi:hypothetical protein
MWGQASFTCETSNSNTLGQEQTAIDDFDGSWAVLPCGVYCDQTGARGRYGQLYDLWLGSTTITMADDYDQTGNKTLGQLRDLIVPSNGVTLQVT